MYVISKCNFAQSCDAPDCKSSVVCIVPKNTVVIVCGETNDSYEIRIDELHHGFVSKEYVVLGGV